MVYRILTCLALAGAALAQTADLSGSWETAVTRYGTTDYGRLNLEAKDGKYHGRQRGLEWEGTLKGNTLELSCSYEEDKEKKDCGKITATLAGAELTGSGKVFDDSISWTAHRIPPRSGSPKKHEFEPAEFHRQFNGNIAPALHIQPGDSVHTWSVDAGGVDAKGVHRSQGGNPLTGPFYIDGAEPGDTLVVHLNRVRLNRDTAGVFSDSVVGPALDPYYFKDLKREKDFDSVWKLDAEHGVAMLSKPTERLKNFTAKLQPMLGCVGVAPPNRQAFQSGNLGRYGGNMDYNQIKEGVTLYFPIFQPGALLFVGDGHALQGDGELTGNALETSMEIEFTVDLIEGKSLGQPRAENDEYVMVMGIGGSLNDALQTATTGISRWLEQEYKLNAGEVAMVLISSMRYDIAEVVDPQVHVVAKLPKSALAQIQKP